MARFTGLAPVLLVPDVRAALDHYRDVLGFDVEEYGLAPEDYGYASRDGCNVHLGARHRATARLAVAQRPPAR